MTSKEILAKTTISLFVLNLKKFNLGVVFLTILFLELLFDNVWNYLYLFQIAYKSCDLFLLINTDLT